MDKNQNIKTWTDGIMIMFIATFLISGIVKTLFLPNEINEYEKRMANTIKDISSVEEFFNMEAQNKIELAFADQIPFSILMKENFNYLNSKVKNYYLSKFADNTKLQYVFLYKDVYKLDDRLVCMPGDKSYILEETKKKLDNFDEIMANHPDINFYIYYIERDKDIYLTTNERLNISEFVKEEIHRDNAKVDSFNINSFEEFKKYFYKTDTHWNYLGSYKGYCEILKMIAPNEEPVKPKQIIKVNKPFIGINSKYIGAGKIYSEEFEAFYFDLPQYDTYVSGKKQKYGREEEYLENPDMTVEYGFFYGQDNGEVIFDFNKPEKENILIIGDSFKNAIIKILASHFNKTYSVDLRNYKREMGEEFKFGEYVKKNNITKVIFCGNVGFYISDDFHVDE